MDHAELREAVAHAWQMLPTQWRSKIAFCTALEQPHDLEAQRRVCCAGPCWQWQGWNSGKGHGKLKEGGKAKMAHRAIYELCVGPIDPPTVLLDHLCRNRGCVNPYHVEPVTPKINTDRGNGKLYQFPAK